MSDKPLTADVLADALGCFHNAAIGALKDQYHPIGCIVAGVNAVAARLREHAAEAYPVEAPKPAPPPAVDPHATARAHRKRLRAEGRMKMDMTDFSRENRDRCTHPNGFNHPLASWSLSDWMTATMGELGEAANVLKKLNRERDGVPGNTQSAEELKAQFADELADTFIYLDLLSQAAGIDLASAVRAKFDRTSAKIGYAGKGDEKVC